MWGSEFGIVSPDFEPMKKAEPSKPAPEMRAEYDFRGGIRGRYADATARDAVALVLEPDVAAAFPDAESVNRALREVLEARRGS